MVTRLVSSPGASGGCQSWRRTSCRRTLFSQRNRNTTSISNPPVTRVGQMQRPSVLKRLNCDVIVVYVGAGAIGGQPTHLWRTTSSAAGPCGTIRRSSSVLATSSTLVVLALLGRRPPYF
jgi:hypothetical protein